METTSISKYKCPECGSNVIVSFYETGGYEANCPKCEFLMRKWNLEEINEYLKQNQRRAK